MSLWRLHHVAAAAGRGGRVAGTLNLSGARVRSRPTTSRNRQAAAPLWPGAWRTGDHGLNRRVEAALADAPALAPAPAPAPAPERARAPAPAPARARALIRAFTRAAIARSGQVALTMPSRAFTSASSGVASADTSGGLSAPATSTASAGGGGSSVVHRTNIGIFGAMNVGKSLLMNTLTQTETSIVDATAGTTADAKVALIELHGIGPVRLVDTPGFDEAGALGAKKQERVRKVLAESDVALIVIDPSEPQSIAVAAALIAEAKRLGFGGPTTDAKTGTETEAAAKTIGTATATGGKVRSEGFKPPGFKAEGGGDGVGARQKHLLIVYNLFREKLDAQRGRERAAATNSNLRGQQPRPQPQSQPQTQAQPDELNARLARIEAQLCLGTSAPASAFTIATGAGATPLATSPAAPAGEGAHASPSASGKSTGPTAGSTGAAASAQCRYHTIVVDLTASARETAGPNRVLRARDGASNRANAASVDVSAPSVSPSAPSAVHQRLCAFIERWVKPQPPPVPLLPPMHALTLDGNARGDAVVLLVVPMDAETPGGRLLRPQAQAQEALLRNFVSTFVFRMNLTKGRSQLQTDRQSEEERFRRTVHMLGPTLKLVITDSQAIDLVHLWTLPAADTTQRRDAVAAVHGTASDNAHGGSSAGLPVLPVLPVSVPVPVPVPVTTFSVMQINYMSGGRLKQFVDGVRALSGLHAGSRVLICEACNHNRIADDIGVVQIPRKIRARWGDGVQIDFAFGREYQSKAIADYDLVLHCGGCMLDLQQMGARLADLERANATAITNYGLALAFLQSPAALARVIQPFGLSLPIIVTANAAAAQNIASA